MLEECLYFLQQWFSKLPVAGTREVQVVVHIPVTDAAVVSYKPLSFHVKIMYVC